MLHITDIYKMNDFVFRGEEKNVGSELNMEQ